MSSFGVAERAHTSGHRTSRALVWRGEGASDAIMGGSRRLIIHRSKCSLDFAGCGVPPQAARKDTTTAPPSGRRARAPRDPVEGAALGARKGGCRGGVWSWGVCCQQACHGTNTTDARSSLSQEERRELVFRPKSASQAPPPPRAAAALVQGHKTSAPLTRVRQDKARRSGRLVVAPRRPARSRSRRQHHRARPHTTQPARKKQASSERFILSFVPSQGVEAPPQPMQRLTPRPLMPPHPHRRRPQ